MWTCCTRSKSSTAIFWALPPLTETVAVQPESHATDRITVEDAGASSRISSDFVVLERTCTGSRRPLTVVAVIGSGGLRRVNTAYPSEKPPSCHGPGTSADDSEPAS